MSEAYENLCYYYRLWCQSKKKPETPEDVENLFIKYIKNENLLSESNLQEFLKFYQGEAKAVASATAKKAVTKSLNRSKTFSRKGLGLDLTDFLHFLLYDDTNSPLHPHEDDLKHTLPHYFVQTSHHSYFEEQSIVQKMITSAHQKKKDDEDYKIIELGIGRALRRGVRVVELYLKVNSSGKNVEVHHKWTPHSSVTVSKCFEAIKENAFKRSPLPVVIILVEEEHINVDLLDKVADKIRKKIGNMLCSSNEAFNIPLENLKYKFIILNRRSNKNPSSHEKTEEKPSEEYRTLFAGYIDDLDDRFMLRQDGETSGVRILSSTESILENAKSSETSDIISFTQENLLEVDLDPKSPNYDPFIGWTRGAQMVNTQNSEKHLYIMQGLFRAYGSSGYVRKPKILLDKQKTFDPTVWRPIKKIIKVKVYMGTGWHLDFGSKQFDATSPPDFFTALEIVGVPEDEAMEKTVPAIDKWIPIWDQEFEFPLTVPELAMLVISVGEFDTDRTHDFGGQTCLPVWLLRNGIRSVPLYTEKGKQYRSARLLIRFQVD